MRISRAEILDVSESVCMTLCRTAGMCVCVVLISIARQRQFEYCLRVWAQQLQTTTERVRVSECALDVWFSPERTVFMCVCVRTAVYMYKLLPDE